ncbi:MAG: hypothetical protein J1E80_09340 [Desulfovibrionaceae bacterium]|nr:hypothetical protein [Desulfovibrionaceae bacterium]
MRGGRSAAIEAEVPTPRPRGRALLEENLNLLHAIAAALLERETITGDDLDLLIQGKPLPPFEASRAGGGPSGPSDQSPPPDDGATFTLHAEDEAPGAADLRDMPPDGDSTDRP